MTRYVSQVSRQMDAITAHFVDQIFSEYDNFLCTVLNPVRVQKYFPVKLGSETYFDINSKH